VQTLSADDLLELHERGAGLHAIDRALALLARALPERQPADLARLPLGSRDALLLAVRQAVLGDQLDAQDDCPTCGERVEVTLRCEALAASCTPPPARWSIEHGRHRLVLRPLDSRDAAAAARCPTVEAAGAELLARAVIAAEHDGAAVAVETLPSEVASRLAGSVATQDAGAEQTQRFSCHAGGGVWAGVLDTASFVWRELAARAERLLLDVHTLARAYGWSQADILAMSGARRAAYVALVTG
jgi:hypothetical protein